MKSRPDWLPNSLPTSCVCTNEIEETEALIEARFREHEHAEILLSMPGFGPLLTTESIAATGGTIAHYETFR
jgi:hypothetical protein